MCVDPATAAMMVSAGTKVVQGGLSYAQGQAQGSTYRQAASQAIMQSAVEETNIRRQSREFLARQRVQALSSGAEVTSGSLAQITEADAETLELNALMRRYEGQQEYSMLRQQGRIATRQGTLGLAGGLLGAGAEVLLQKPQFPKAGSPSGGGRTIGRVPKQTVPY